MKIFFMLALTRRLEVGAQLEQELGTQRVETHYVTVKTVALVALPPAVVTAIFPVTVPLGTVAVTCVAELIVKAVAFTPANVTVVVCDSPVPEMTT